MPGIAEKFKQSAQGRLLSTVWQAQPGTAWSLLLFNCFLRAYRAFRNGMLRLVGIGVAGVDKEWIAIASAAASGGHRLALLHGLKAAGAHSGSDVLAAILTRARRRRRRHRNISQCQQRGGGPGGNFQKLFHCFLSVCFDPRNRHGMSIKPAPSTPKKSKAILSGVWQTLEIHRVTVYKSTIIIQWRAHDCDATRSRSLNSSPIFGFEASMAADDKFGVICRLDQQLSNSCMRHRGTTSWFTRKSTEL